MIEKIKIIILAAGHGKRMKSELPKVLTPLRDKPLITYLLDSVKKSGVCDRPTIIVGQQRELVMKTLGSGYDYVTQEEQLGTGHAVMMAQKTLENNADNIITLYGDHPFISPLTIKKLAEKNINSKAKITMATVKLPDFENWRKVFYTNFSRIIRDKNGNIIKSVEFRDATDEEKKITEVNPSFFCFEARWLWKNLKIIQNNNTQKEYYLTDLVKIAMQEKMKIDSIDIDPREALGANSKEELGILEKLM